MYIYTFYGYNQEQQQCHLPQETVNILDAVADHAKAHGKPYLIGGDFNATPQDVHIWSRQHMAPARLVHCLGATCRPATGTHRTLGFFFMSPILADIIEDPIVDIQTLFRPHSPVFFQKGQQRTMGQGHQPSSFRLSHSGLWATPASSVYMG